MHVELKPKNQALDRQALKLPVRSAPTLLYHMYAWARVRPSPTLFSYFQNISSQSFFFVLKGRLRSSLFFTDDGGQIAQKLENNLNGGG